MEASLTGPGGQRTGITSNTLTIGRAPDNQLVLQDQQASSHHAEIRPDAQGYLLIDMNSRNGTFVNEQRLMPQTPRLLISGDVICVGETRLNYEIAGTNDEATMRANAGDYANPGYSPTVAVPPPSQPDYMNYQQPAPAAPSFQQPAPPAYSGFRSPSSQRPTSKTIPRLTSQLTGNSHRRLTQRQPIHSNRRAIHSSPPGLALPDSPAYPRPQ